MVFKKYYTEKIKQSAKKIKNTGIISYKLFFTVNGVLIIYINPNV